MITHFAELRLSTVSLLGVRQVYGDRLALPIAKQTDDSLSFQVTPDSLLTFVERSQPIAPAHFAFEVAYATFYDAVAFVRNVGLLVLRHTDGAWYGDGREIIEEEGFRNLYFHDGDGNILEILARDTTTATPKSDHPLRIVSLNEIGFPVERLPDFRRWALSTLDLHTESEADAAINFVQSGSACMVVVATTRPWVPVATRALPTGAHVSFGTPHTDFLETVRGRLAGQGILAAASDEHEIQFTRDGYTFSLRYTPEVAL